jgi:myo-inositol-1(or 4)-monophosphatase
MPSTSRAHDIGRIRNCLQSVAELVARRDVREICMHHAHESNPSTALDREIDRFIFENLPLPGEGWLSEESPDDRLDLPRVWVVDPIDGTREFVQGIPEWCVSIALMEGQQAVAGGILNPSTGEMFLGSLETGLKIEGPRVHDRYRSDDGSPCLLVSRREHREGKWEAWEEMGMHILPVGSIAYRLALVAAGYADATSTFEPRSEWDIAGGVALVLAAGGDVQMLNGSPVRFNNAVPLVENFFAFGKNCPACLRGIPETGGRLQ